ncbi:Receptor-type guanylate cyclase gcy [Seminavis robusta]|uniref:Receptor-type guanylate cyclase gcy n=1 Tax=Seminavis robusta TaxID=568900 RepID=A0A9N8DRW6_9STRA|nr:Receptor-type guanylate cyclase gcy [Seminavis robusta]|eukprot:Sro297_g110880.1 Receptor-type guanylate cyclase gcy (738) ;mRNA; r:26141-28864
MTSNWKDEEPSMSVMDDGAKPGDGQEQFKLDVAQKEAVWVFRLRVLTGIVLVGVAVAVCLVVYFAGRQSETESFETDFEALSEKLVLSFEQTVEQRFGIIASFGQDITSQANGSWPFVAPKDFNQRADAVSILAQLMAIRLMPRVEKENYNLWNDWAFDNQGWKAEGLAFQTGIPVDQVNAGIINHGMINVHNPNGPTPANEINPDGPHFPTWCVHPAANSSEAENLVDLYGDFEHKGPIDLATETGLPIFEPSYDYMGGNEKDMRYDFITQTTHIEYLDDPHGTAMFPVFDSLDVNTRKVVAVFYTFIYWRTYFDNLLPPGADGIFVILENTCNQTYTYQVNGVHSQFIGHGDLHDPKYDELGTGTTVAVSTDAATNAEILATDFSCQYSIRVYPSQDFEDSHRSSTPAVYAAVLAFLFVFTSFIFLLYDYMVEQRQKAVLTSAMQSGKLVSSLFPKEVREQLYKEQQAQTNQQEKKDNWKNTNTQESEGGFGDNKKAMIASLYPETTIFFADLAGFTKWSSSRTPEEVFELLEAVYGAFDAIAQRRRVFKVETIGDCYVAVTGLPNPQTDHAVIMCKFANDCLAKFKTLTASLATTMGEDTATLCMRIGLHSGPVTGGVLRGQKSRFQLFGDTVNTASRMESNGVKNRIHVSQQTADALMARGKNSWITAREEKIEAKGKGSLQTYWVDLTSRSNSVTSSTVTSAYSSGEIQSSRDHTSRSTDAGEGGFEDIVDC